MASISTDSSGRKTVQYTWRNKRWTIRLGEVSKRTAEAFREKLECLIGTARLGIPMEKSLYEWAAAIDPAIHDKLAAAGLLEPRANADPVQVPALGAFLQAFIAGRKDVAESTRKVMVFSGQWLTKHFGEDKVLSSITQGEADDWLVTLRTSLSGASCGRCVKHARQFFKAAIRKGYCANNPFNDIAAPSQVNEARLEFIARPVVLAVLEACPTVEWRAIIALSRFGGLRFPSETLGLRLNDIDWARNRFTVTSPKKRGKPTGFIRSVPIFHELRPFLEDVFELAAIGQEYVIHSHREEHGQLRWQFKGILRKAGVDRWQRLFHQLRASRETELTAVHPIHVVCAWLGNTPAVAAKHYLSVRESDFERAAGCAAPLPDISTAPLTAQPAADQTEDLKIFSPGIRNNDVSS